jgi:hypothetical protein
MTQTKLPAIIAMVLSLVLVGAGVVLVTQGLIAKSDVRTALEAERITTPDDATIPNVPVNSAATALAQAEIIQLHALEATEGRTWADMDREDPMRPFYLSAVTLRTSLMSAYMAFKLADLVTGLGALFLVIGLGSGVATGFALRSSAAAPAAVREEERIAVGA